MVGRLVGWGEQWCGGGLWSSCMGASARLLWAECQWSSRTNGPSRPTPPQKPLRSSFPQGFFGSQNFGQRLNLLDLIAPLGSSSRNPKFRTTKNPGKGPFSRLLTGRKTIFRARPPARRGCPDPGTNRRCKSRGPCRGARRGVGRVRRAGVRPARPPAEPRIACAPPCAALPRPSGCPAQN